MPKPNSDCRATERKHPWLMARLGDVCETINGIWKGTKAPLVTVGIIRSTNMTKQCEFSLEKTVYVDVEERKYRQRKLLPGDIIVERSGGGPGQPVGRAVYFDVKDGEYSVSNFTSILRVKDDACLSAKFLQKCLTAQYFQGVTEGIQSNTTGLHNLDFEAYLNIEIPLPPLSVQREIVARLERELAAVEKMKKGFEALAETAKAEFKAELKDVFEELKHGGVGIETNGTDGTNETVETRRLGDVCKNLDSRRVPITKSNREAGKYPYYGASGVVDWVSGYIFDGDYLLVSEDGANLIARSTPIAFSVSGKIWVNNHAHILAFSDLATQRFVEFYFASIKIDDLVTGAAQPKLTQNALNSIEIPFPPLADQREVVARLDSAKARAEKLEAKAREGVAVCETMRKAILKEAFE